MKLEFTIRIKKHMDNDLIKGTTSNDWALREDKVIIESSKDIIDEIMESLAESSNVEMV